MTRLIDQIIRTSRRAAASGALVTVPTSTVTVDDGGVPFVVHVTELQQSKRAATAAPSRAGHNPFLPPDPELLIRDVSPTHLAVLNKFNVLAHHLLVITRDFEAQEALLTEADFEALAACMAEFDGLGFYNGGVVAGASQEHKHLQLVPLPLGDGAHPTPLDAVVDSAGSSGLPTLIPSLGFAHRLIPLDGAPLHRGRAAELARIYRSGCTDIGVVDERQPYNMLVTRRWMMLVPRSRECWEGVSINALGFAGSLLVRTAAELERVREIGPLAVLGSVVGPRQRSA